MIANRFRASCLLLVVLALGVPAASGETEPPEPATPRASVLGYLTACRDGNYAQAAEYLDLRRLPPSQWAERGPELARQLKVVLDRTLWVDIESLSDEPTGKPDDGLPAERDAVGSVEGAQETVDILVERVPSPSGPVWKISSATLARVPALYDEFGYGTLGRFLPEPFFELRLLEIQLWQWLGLVLTILVAWGLSWFVAMGVVRAVRPLVAGTATSFDDRLLEIVVGPLRLLVGTALFAFGTLPLGLTVPAQRLFGGVEKALVFVAVLWLSFRLVDVFSHWASDRLVARGQVAVRSMLPVGRRVVKVILASVAGIALLQNLGLNVTGLVAGLGVGGLAVALAAQRSLENLFGGVTVIADQPVRVGDFCRFGDRIGTVEDIGLRSTRVRTLDRTVVTVPNAEFSQMQLENFAKRDSIWYHPRIGLRYETTPEQIRFILVEIRRLLYSHPRVDPEPARIRFVGFGACSLDLDVFAYVRATDYGEFLEIAEDLNLRIMDIVERAGSSFAFPSQTLYLEQGEGLDAEKARGAEEHVREWRERQALCLPKFPKEEVERLAGSIEYPPEGAAVRS